MKTFHEGELVSVTRDGEVLDGVVSHVASILKIEVAVPDPERGAIIRTVHPRALAERAEAGPDDQSLQRLIQRTSVGGRGGPRAGQGPGRGARGHGRATGHRTTGK
jgi:hypothetical protein